jgi:hypothetical protein
MAYQNFTVTSLAVIPALVAAFATSNGWTVNSSNPTEPTFTHPTFGAAVPFRLKSPAVDKLTFEAASAPSTIPSSTIVSPKLSQGSFVPLIPPPTVLHVFCAQTPEPHIALVIEYGYNLYRHLYFGYMEKIGGYTGGEVVGAANSTFTTYPVPFYNITNQYLFGSLQNQFASIESGGVRAVHASNPEPWRKFRTSGALSAFDNNHALGGYLDGINDGFVQLGKSPFAGGAILTPINLYAVRNPGINVGFAPIGRPSGVRMVNMEDLAPGAQIAVGLENWRVFPAFSKNVSPSGGVPAGGFPYCTFESSYYVGYAYLES